LSLPVFQQPINLNELFNQLSEPPIIINDLENNSEEDKEHIKELITSRYSGDMITLLPSCRCGATKGEFSLGIKCGYCNTYVRSSLENEIEPSIWFRKPIGTTSLMSPISLKILRDRFKKSGFDIIQYIMDTTYRPTVKTPPVIHKLHDYGLQRGYNYFVENFDWIMELLFSRPDLRTANKAEDWTAEYITAYRDTIFCDYIPLPNKALLVIEKTNVGIYVDPVIVQGVDAIGMLVSIDKDFHDQNPRVKENRTAKALIKLTDFYWEYYETNFRPKGSLYRRHVYGSRTIFSMRAVITSLTDTHDYREIHVPWGAGIAAFRPHLINRLLRMGMDLNSAQGFLMSHVTKYHPTIDLMLKQLIDESPGKGLEVTLGRNPSLLQGSIQNLKITKFKTDPTDTTISMSILVVTAPNAQMGHYVSDGVCEFY
jgi:hypothetical protein